MKERSLIRLEGVLKRIALRRDLYYLRSKTKYNKRLLWVSPLPVYESVEIKLIFSRRTIRGVIRDSMNHHSSRASSRIDISLFTCLPIDSKYALLPKLILPSQIKEHINTQG